MEMTEITLDAVEGEMADGSGPAWFEVEVLEEAGAVVLVRHDDLGQLLGWVADPRYQAVAVAAGGPVRHLDGGGAPPGGPPERADVVVVATRRGELASRADLGGRTVVDGCDGGQLVDALRRALRLPTPTPEHSSAQLFTELWLLAVIDAARRAPARLGWDEVCDAHPAVAAAADGGTILAGRERAAVIRGTHRSWSWEHLRRRTADGAGLGAFVDAGLARWMDEGMFARFVLGRLPDPAHLLDEAVGCVDDDAAARLRGDVERAGAVGGGLGARQGLGGDRGSVPARSSRCQPGGGPGLEGATSRRGAHRFGSGGRGGGRR